jgi:hypothetical protein
MDEVPPTQERLAVYEAVQWAMPAEIERGEKSGAARRLIGHVRSPERTTAPDLLSSSIQTIM